MRNFNKLALLVVLGSGFAVAQSMPQSTSPSTSSPSSSQSQPASPDQQPSTTAPDQGKNPANAPETLPNTDQKKSDSQSQDQNKMPQSDASPSASATSGTGANGDVQGNIQSAIQKDPSLATAGVNVAVNGKNVELTGTVPNKDAKESAERIAKENAGGLKVKNHLKVASNSDKKSDTTSNPKL